MEDREITLKVNGQELMRELVRSYINEATTTIMREPMGRATEGVQQRAVDWFIVDLLDAFAEEYNVHEDHIKDRIACAMQEEDDDED